MTQTLIKRLGVTMDMIKIAHTIFALPFALLAAVVAAGGLPTFHQLFWIVAACFFARSAAMTFNRIHDQPWDRLNPRTREWALPAGLVTRRFAWSFLAFAIAGFIVSAGMLNGLALALSPLTLVILLGYSTAKRWTAGSHFLLGLALGIAPVGAWVGVRGTLFNLPPFLIGAGVLCWVAGFDIIYSCQDEAFDRAKGLFSLPARIGRTRALAISALCHAAATTLFLLAGWAGGLGVFYLIAVAGAACLLAWEQSIVTPRDLSRLGQAFFTLNGWISMLIFLGGLTDVLSR